MSHDAAERPCRNFAELLEQARQGSEEAAATLVSRHGKHLVKVARRMVSEKLQAKFGGSDLVQEAMMRAIEKIAQFEGESPEEFTSWLWAFVENTNRLWERRYLERKKRAVERERSLEDIDAELAFIGVAHRRHSSVAFRTAMWEAMAEMDVETQELVRWRFEGRLTYAEMGRRLGISEEAARKRCVRGLEVVRRSMEAA